MNKKAFTLIELLAVIVIIGILGILTVPNVLKYFHESKIKAMLVQENKLVESGDILVRDYCKKPLNDQYRLECNDNYQSLENTNDETKIDDDPLTYTKYICISTLKDKNYYSEKLQFSGEDCSGVVVYRIDEETDIQKDSFAVVKCGTSYKTIFENENNEDYEEFLKTTTRADKLADVFKDCFTEQPTTPQPPEINKEYQLTINFTEHNQYGQQVAETISEKVLQGNSVTKYVPPYKSYDGTNEEHFTPFVHGSSDDVIDNAGNKVKPTIVSDKLNFIMPANNVTINIAYSINQYTVTFNHIDAVLGTSTIGGQNYNSNSYKLFNGESVKIPYKEIPNFKIVSHSNGKQTDYVLNEHDNKIEEILYQQEKFNLAYNENNGSECPNEQTEYDKKFETLCTTTKTGYRFQTWDLDGEPVNNDTHNRWYRDITLNANWDKNKYYVRYNCNGGTPSTAYESEHYYDTPSKLAANQCKKEGYYFSKWTSDGGAEPSYTNEKDIMNLTDTHLGTVKLYATYSPHYVTVIYNPKDATTIKFEGNIKQVDEFKTISKSKYYYNVFTETGLPNVQNDSFIYLEREGYTPTGNWYSGTIKLSDKTGVSGKTLAEHFGLDISNKNETLNLYPEWKINEYKFRIDPNGGYRSSDNVDGIVEVTKKYQENDNVSERRKAGYTLTGYTMKNSSNNSTTDLGGATFTFDPTTKTGVFKQGSVPITLTATWSPNIYKVTLNNQGATTAGTLNYWYIFNTTKKIGNETAYYYTNAACTSIMTNYQITIPEKTGYTFDGYWSQANGKGTQYINSNGFAINDLYKSKSENTTLYAKWVANSYTLTIDPNGGYRKDDNVADIIKVQRDYDQTDNVVERVKEGYTLTGYTIKNSNNNLTTDLGGATFSFDPITKTGIFKQGSVPITLTAIWSPNIYKVTLDNQDATVSGTKEYWYYYNTSKNGIYYYLNSGCTTAMENYTITKPQKTGYTFGGYYTGVNGTGTQYIDSSGVAINNIYKEKLENTTLYAKWDKNYIEVTYHPNGANVIEFKGTSMSDSQFMSTTKQKIYYDTYMEYGLPDIKNHDWFYLTRNGYRSTGKWYSGSYILDQTTAITGKTLAEYFGLDISKESKTLDIYAQWQQCSENTYSNIGNNSCDACINGYYSSAGATKCNPIEYTITYNLNGGTQGTNPKTSYNIETATFNLPTPTRANYTFDGWYTTSNFSGSKVTSISKGSTGNKTYFAKWKESYKNEWVNGVSGTLTYDATDYLIWENAKVILTYQESYNKYLNQSKIKIMNFQIYSPAEAGVVWIGGGEGESKGVYINDEIVAELSYFKGDTSAYIEGTNQYVSFSQVPKALPWESSTITHLSDGTLEIPIKIDLWILSDWYNSTSQSGAKFYSKYDNVVKYITLTDLRD